MTIPHLNGHHRTTLGRIFAHPAPHNVEWHDVVSLLNHLGSVGERHGGGYTVAIGDQQVVLARPHGHDLADAELRHLREFLTQAGLSGEPAAIDPPGAWAIVLIDHHQARLFAPGSKPGDKPTLYIIRPNDDDGSRRRVEHRQGNDDHDGGHASEDEGFYRRIATELDAAHAIVVFSDGHGRANAGAYLVSHLKHHDSRIAARIVASDTIDIAQMSDAQVVAAGLARLGAQPVTTRSFST